MASKDQRHLKAHQYTALLAVNKMMKELPQPLREMSRDIILGGLCHECLEPTNGTCFCTRDE